ncbi:hypothetical protein CRENBAI_002502 [Crenichthys baileyi]|uniref:Uncharacterized protein n=1 Tax=Crenichthys baileyi TaxID=28760 RepID=A0AAV9R342_9TELE
MNRLHTPILSLVLFQRGSWMNRLHIPILFLILSWRAPRMNCLHPWFPFRRSSLRTCFRFLFLSLRSARTHPLCMLSLGASATDLYGLTEVPSGLCTDHLGSSGLRTAPLSYTLGSPGPAACHQIIDSYISGLLSSYVAGLLIAGSAGDGHRAGRLNSGSAGDGLAPLGPARLGNPKAFPGQPRNIVLPACPGSSSGAPPNGTCLEHLTREASRRHPSQMPEPPQLARPDVERQWLYSKPPPRMTELFTLSLRESPDTLRRKLISPACIHDLVLSVMTQSSWP